MTDKPILFSTPMIRANLYGRKWQTRRILSRQWTIDGNPSGRMWDNLDWSSAEARETSTLMDAIAGPRNAPPDPHLRVEHRDERWGTYHRVRPPIKAGDRLWVRESFWQVKSYPGCFPSGESNDGSWGRLIHYAADGDPPNCGNSTYGPDGLKGNAFAAPDPWATWQKRPSIHMRRRASRLTLIVTDVKVERVQDISEEDAMAEGIERAIFPIMGEYEETFHSGVGRKDVEWTSDPIDAFGALWDSIHGPEAWDRNYWVFAITYTAYRCNIDAFDAASEIKTVRIAA